jgi:glucose-1-phosphate cytidylyltransferase
MNKVIQDTPVVILAGGRGTRLAEETRIIPKPMVTIGGKPILLHIMRYYAAFGFKRFVICLGYKGHVIKEYFAHLGLHMSDMAVHGDRGVEYLEHPGRGWETMLVETGEYALTALRLWRVKQYLDMDHFCLTYGDGLSDVDLSEEMEFHVHHDALGTVTAVHPPSDDVVNAFKEKVHLQHDYINGGFFIFRRAFLDRLAGDRNETLEGAALEKLAADGELKAFRHEGFWSCMDTLRDRELLNDIFESGKAPWIRG